MSEELIKLLTEARKDVTENFERMLEEKWFSIESMERSRERQQKLLSDIDSALTAQQEPVVPDGLIAALRNQRQIDEDGTECGVSRQAVDEAADILEKLYTAPASGVREGMMRAPWPDFLGQPIYHGDRISHPDGNEFIAIRLGTDDDSWRAVYGEDGAISRLSLQVGDKGQAFVVTRAADQVNAEGRESDKAATDEYLRKVNQGYVFKPRG